MSAETLAFELFPDNHLDMPLRHIRSFSEILPTEIYLAGGKGASLADLTRAGFTVPLGCVVLTTAFDEMLEQEGLKMNIERCLRETDFGDLRNLEACSQQITDLMNRVIFPEEIKQSILLAFDQLGASVVAVRSSATAEDGMHAAWAGQLESYLNTTREMVVMRVKNCWTSLFSPRALAYRFEQGLIDQSISVAVVMQTMVQSDVSGIAFSLHPVTQRMDQVVIEAGYGLGEAIVSGQITPDTYIVDKLSKQPIEKHIASQDRMITRGQSGGDVWIDVLPEDRAIQKLTDQDIRHLSDLVLRIEQHYGFPVDIEWAKAGNTFYILQSRPVTTQ